LEDIIFECNNLNLLLLVSFIIRIALIGCEVRSYLVFRPLASITHTEFTKMESIG